MSFNVPCATRRPASCPISSKGKEYDLVSGTSDSSKCSAPLSQNNAVAQITLERIREEGPFPDVKTFLSGGASCSLLALSVLLEDVSDDSNRVIECSMVSQGSGVGAIRECVYSCHCSCTSVCKRAHLLFRNLAAAGIDNTGWTVCGIQMCMPWGIQKICINPNILQLAFVCGGKEAWNSARVTVGVCIFIGHG